jgi:thioredoxin 1
MEHIFTDANFNDEVLKSTQPVFVDFWAPWCGPCRVLSPIIDELSKEYEGKIKVAKINVDENNMLASQFGVMSIPTVKFFKNGKVIAEQVGAAPKEAIEQIIKKVLA